MKRICSLVLCIFVLLGFTPYGVLGDAGGAISILNPVSSEKLNIADDLDVKAAIGSGFSEARFYLDDVLKGTISTPNETGIYTLAIGSAEFTEAKEYNLRVEADYGTETESASVDFSVIFYGPTVNNQTIEFEEFTAGMTSSELGTACGLTYNTNNKGSFDPETIDEEHLVSAKATVNANTTSSLPYFQLQDIYITNGILEYSFDVYPSADQGIRMHFGFIANGNVSQGALYILNYDGTIAGSNVHYAAEDWNHISLFVNTVSDTYSIYLNNEWIDTGALSQNIDLGVKNTRINFASQSAQEEYFVLDNIEIYKTEALPYVESLSYVGNDGAEVDQDDFIDGKVSIFANEIKLNMSGAIDAGSITGKVTLKKIDETVVNSKASVSGSTISIKPSDYLELGDYKVVLGAGITSSGVPFGKNMVIKFATRVHFGILSPVDDGVLEIKDGVLLSAAAPNATKVEFIINGVTTEMTLSESGYYSYEISAGDCILGQNTFAVYAEYADGTYDYESRMFTLKDRIISNDYGYDFDGFSGQTSTLPSNWSVDSNYTNWGTLETEVGPDGGDDTAIKIRGTKTNSGSTYFQYSLPRTYNSGVIVIENDLKISYDGRYDYLINTSSGIMYLGGVTRLFAPDGVIEGSDANYKNNEWAHVKFVLDLEAGLSDLYYDGVRVLSGISCNSDVKSYLRIRISNPRSTAFGELAIDNFKIYNQVEIPSVSSLGYVVESVETIAGRENLVSEDTTGLNIYLDGALKADSVTSDNIEIVLDGVSVTPASINYDATDKKIGITLSSPIGKYKSGYVLIKDSIELPSGVTAGKATRIPILTCADEMVYYEDVVLEDADGNTLPPYSAGNVTATIKAVNGNEDPVHSYAFLVSYAGEKLTNVKVIDLNLQKGDNYIKESLNVPSGSDSVKVLIWNSLSEIMPILPAAGGTIQ